ELRLSCRSDFMSSRFDLGKKPHLGYTGSILDRAAELRHDPAAIAALAADPRARTLVIAGELVCLRNGEPFNDPTFTLAQAALMPAADRPHEQAFLGPNADAAQFPVPIAPDTPKALKNPTALP